MKTRVSSVSRVIESTTRIALKNKPCMYLYTWIYYYRTSNPDHSVIGDYFFAEYTIVENRL